MAVSSAPCTLESSPPGRIYGRIYGRFGQDSGRAQRAAPLIDVLLVLLVTAMLAGIRHVLDVQVPEPVALGKIIPPPQIVLELLPKAGYAINGQPVPDERLDATLQQIYAGRPVKLLFVKAAGDRSYQEVLSAMDRGKGVGVQVIALMPG